MKFSVKTQKYIFFVVLAAIFVWFFCDFFYPFGLRYQEPLYQGKKLTYWAKQIDQSDFLRLPAYQQHQKQNEQAVFAIRQIGTNALPVALKLCRAKDPWLKRKWEEWTHRYNISALDKHFEGINIIWALGPMTKPIIPDLIQLLQSRDEAIAETVMDALPGAGTNAIPPLIELLNSSNKDVRLRAAITLGDFFRPKTPRDEPNGSLITTGSEAFRSQARAAVPVLLSHLDSHDINLTQRLHVIHALGLIREDAPVVLPVLVRHIQNESNTLIRASCFWALGSFGTNAECTVPMLVNILKSNPDQPNSWDKGQVLGNLLRVDPETAKPFLNQWKASVTNTDNNH